MKKETSRNSPVPPIASGTPSNPAAPAGDSSPSANRIATSQGRAQATFKSTGPARATTASTSRSPVRVAPTPGAIAARAHELWVQAGLPHGRDLDHWLQAEQELQEAQSDRAIRRANAQEDENAFADPELIFDANDEPNSEIERDLDDIIQTRDSNSGRRSATSL